MIDGDHNRYNGDANDDNQMFPTASEKTLSLTHHQKG